MRRVLLVLALAGCQPGVGDSTDTALDTSATDSGGDTGSNDTGSNDTGSNDTDSNDTDSNETGSNDTGPVDTGTDDPGPTFAACPAGVTCVASFPFVDSDTTLGGDRDLDAYSCAPSTNESGPERVYRLDLAEDAFVAVSLGNLGSGVDVDVHLLGSLDADDCLDRGHWTAGSLVPAGSWFLVVDTWVSGTGSEKAGAFTVSVGVTTVSDLVGYGMSSGVAAKALHVFDRAWQADQTERFEYGVIDFSKLSTQERFWVVDLGDGSLLYELLVAHGSGSNPGSDPRLATVFSNTVDSHMSSLGLAKTAETYWGQWDYSLRLDGLDPGYNSKIRERAIVIHGADWASQEFVDDNGYLGLSWGCPTVDTAVSTELIDTLKGGALVWSWYPSSAFEADSTWLDGF